MNAFGTIDGDDKCTTFVALNGAGDDLADALGEAVVEGVALVFAEALDHDLLEGLRGDAAQVLGVDVEGVAVAADIHIAGEAVDGAGEFLGVEGLVVLACGGDHRLLEVADEEIAVDIAVACDGVEDSDHFLGVHALLVPLCLDVWLSGYPRRGGAKKEVTTSVLETRVVLVLGPLFSAVARV